MREGRAAAAPGREEAARALWGMFRSLGSPCPWHTVLHFAPWGRYHGSCKQAMRYLPPAWLSQFANLGNGPKWQPSRVKLWETGNVHLPLSAIQPAAFLGQRGGRRSVSQSPAPGPQYSLRTRLLVVSLVGLQILLAWLYVRSEKEQQRKRAHIEELRKVALGQGDFQLVDHTGKPFSKEDLKGSWVLLYFGFTHCPDICPEELEKMSQVVSLLDQRPQLPRIQPLFITVDPERDTVAAVAKYVKDFHPRLRGLTGTPDQVRDVSRAFRVYYSTGPKDEDNDYIVDHSVILYLLDPDGFFADYYNRYKTKEKIAQSIEEHMGTYKRLFG